MTATPECTTVQAASIDGSIEIPHAWATMRRQTEFVVSSQRKMILLTFVIVFFNIAGTAICAFSQYTTLFMQSHTDGRMTDFSGAYMKAGTKRC
jgi:hypothetical protein